MRDQEQKAYLLYAYPIPGALSGHCAFVILRPGETLTADNLVELTNEKIDYYYSMYPNVSPSVLRKKPLIKHVNGGLPAYTMHLYDDDVMMRGQSRFRFDYKIKEDVSVEVLVKQGFPSIQSEKGRAFFLKGQYDCFVKLPSSLDLSAVKVALDRVESQGEWGMFAPLPQLLSWKTSWSLSREVFWSAYASVSKVLHQKRPIYNCCSAIRDSLVTGDMQLVQSPTILMMPTFAAYVLWGAYLIALMLNPTPFSFDNGYQDAVQLAPLAYLFYRFALALKHGHDYFVDLNQMNRNIGFPVKQVVYLVCQLINMIAFIATPKALPSAFDFPSALFRDVSAVKGVETTRASKTGDIAFVHKDELMLS